MIKCKESVCAASVSQTPTSSASVSWCPEYKTGAPQFWLRYIIFGYLDWKRTMPQHTISHHNKHRPSLPVSLPSSIWEICTVYGNNEVHPHASTWTVDIRTTYLCLHSTKCPNKWEKRDVWIWDCGMAQFCQGPSPLKNSVYAIILNSQWIKWCRYFQKNGVKLNFIK